MAEISEGLNKCKMEKPSADGCSSDVFKLLPFQDILQKESVSVTNIVELKDNVMDGYSEEESVIQIPVKEIGSKPASMHECNRGQTVVDSEQSTVVMKSRRFRETDSSRVVLPFQVEEEEEGPQAFSEPHFKRFKSIFGSASDGECSASGKGGGGGDEVLHSEDEYEHVQSGLVYIITSYAGAGVPHDIYDDHIQGCQCNGLCSDGCRCSLQYGCPYENGELQEHHYRKPIFECNDWCTCSVSDCPNRVVQRGPVTGLKILSLQDKGFGVVSSCFIPRNSFVCEYAGEYISVEEARVRFSQQRDEGSNYILVLREHVQGTASGPYITVIDPTVVGNIGRYINHSCDPNLVVVPVRINSMLPLAALFAIRDILPGEELCYDYSNRVILDENEAASSAIQTIAARSSGSCFDSQVYTSKVDIEEVGRSTSPPPHKVVDIEEDDNVIILAVESPKSEGCEMSNVLSSDKNVVIDNEIEMDSSSRLLKLCLCKSKNCRKFLPADKDII